jgi:hypothetical protein
MKIVKSMIQVTQKEEDNYKYYFEDNPFNVILSDLEIQYIHNEIKLMVKDNSINLEERNFLSKINQRLNEINKIDIKIEYSITH